MVCEIREDSCPIIAIGRDGNIDWTQDNAACQANAQTLFSLIILFGNTCGMIRTDTQQQIDISIFRFRVLHPPPPPPPPPPHPPRLPPIEDNVEPSPTVNPPQSTPTQPSEVSPKFPCPQCLLSPLRRRLQSDTVQENKICPPPCRPRPGWD